MKKNAFIALCLFVASATYFFLTSNDTTNKGKVIYLHEHATGQRSASIFDTFAKNGNVIAIFYADWCNPCKRAAPIIDELAGILPDFTFLKLQYDTYKNIAKKYIEHHGMKGIPSFLFFKNGVLLEVYSQGPMTKQEWLTKINSLYNTNY